MEAVVLDGIRHWAGFVPLIAEEQDRDMHLVPIWYFLLSETLDELRTIFQRRSNNCNQVSLDF